MGDRLSHRGPDDAGYLLDSPGWSDAQLLGRTTDGEAPPATLGLVHRRLSIIDVAGGAQPMSNADRSLWIVYNGEVYNHRSLRSELEGAGHVFRSACDTEVVLRAYQEWGAASVERLDGIFAFAIWDRRAQRLFLARDRLGAKPLYYALRGRRFAFASEVKALLALPWLDAELDPAAAVEHFTFMNTFGSRTFFSGVEMLEPGHHVTVTADGPDTPVQYWDLVYEPDDSVSLADWATALRDEFADTVTAQLMSEVPVGTFLSGGMDTGAITAVAGRTIRPLHTFTCGFDLSGGVDEREEQHFDERAAGASLAAELGTAHHEMVVRAGDLVDVLPTLVWHLDEPRVGISYQNYLVNRLVTSEVTVVLSGVGGDELFGGYPWRYRPASEWRDVSVFDDRYFGLLERLVPARDHGSFFTGSMLQAAGASAARDAYEAVLGKAQSDDPVHRAMWFDAKTFLHGLLVVEDKLSMAHSVESRVPFCGNRLVDLVRHIPSSTKLSDDDTKIVLKEAFRELLPPEALTRRKVGFTPPDATWYRGPMRGFVEDLVLSPRALARGVFEPAAVRRVVGEHQSGSQNHRFLLWSLMCFEWWNRLFVEGRSKEKTCAHS
jgi:asparagine synthase (glutamine-hydrolysing)